MRPLIAVQETLLLQRGHLFPWLAVCLGTGIGIHFSLRFEPGPMHYAGLGGVVVLLLLSVRPLGPAFGPIAIGLAVIALGAGLAGSRSHLVEAPVLGFRYYGPVEGRIIEIDRSARDVPRITLDPCRAG